MKHYVMRSAYGIALAGVVLLLLSAAAFLAGARINTTKSIARGLYWTTSAPVEKGAYVLLCPPQGDVFETAKQRGYIAAGPCPGGYGYMMKRVLAAQGDTVSITDAGVLVDGALLPHSTPRAADTAGRPLPRPPSAPYTLGASALLLMSDISDTSFDGRYFGPISRSQIKTVIRPVLTW